ncbi:hypothetical protein, partial [Klebsiella pneumoniae]|uniref:hypothetical protein n=1 Tax=Klebsiella pneumoniae TaxID=573 RepID=UPI0040555E6D
AQNVRWIGYDPVTDILYWLSGRQLRRSFHPGAKHTSIKSLQAVGNSLYTSNEEVHSLAVDWSAGNLYWIISSSN